MDNKVDILDVPKIQKEVKKRHGEFIKEYASEIDKTWADHKLFTDIMLAKINRIALIFKEEGVVDEIKMGENGSVKELCLYKNGCRTYVRVATNGKDIYMEAYTWTSSDFVSDFKMPSEKMFSIDREKFDWIDFSKKLLDYIHTTIYDRKEVVETRLEGMFKDVPKDTTKKVLKK